MLLVVVAVVLVIVFPLSRKIVLIVLLSSGDSASFGLAVFEVRSAAVCLGLSGSQVSLRPTRESMDQAIARCNGLPVLFSYFSLFWLDYQSHFLTHGAYDYPTTRRVFSGEPSPKRRVCHPEYLGRRYPGPARGYRRAHLPSVYLSPR